MCQNIENFGYQIIRVKIALSPCKCKQFTHVKMYLALARKIENIPYKKVKI